MRKTYQTMLHISSSPSVLAVSSGNHLFTSLKNQDSLSAVTKIHDAKTQILEMKSLSRSSEVVFAINSKDIFKLDVVNQNVFNIGKSLKRAACMTITSLETSSNRVEEIAIVGDRGGDVYAHSVAENSSKKRFLCGHTASILTQVLVTGLNSKTNMRYLLTSDKDEKIRVSEFPSSFHIQAQALGHTRTVQALQTVVEAVYSEAEAPGAVGGNVTRDLVYNSNELFLSGGQDGTLRVWHLLSGTLLSTLYLDERAAEASAHIVSSRSGNPHLSYLAHRDADMNHSHEAAEDEDNHQNGDHTGDGDPSDSMEAMENESSATPDQSESSTNPSSKLIIPPAFVMRNLNEMKPATIYDSPTHIHLVGFNENGNPIYVCSMQNRTKLTFFSLRAHPLPDRVNIPSTNEKGGSYPQVLIEKISTGAEFELPGNVMSLEKLNSSVYIVGGFFGSKEKHEIKAVKIELSKSSGRIIPTYALLDPQPAYIVQLNDAIQSCPVPVAPVLTFDGN
jgi:hypothetical protein